MRRPYMSPQSIVYLPVPAPSEDDFVEESCVCFLSGKSPSAKKQTGHAKRDEVWWTVQWIAQIRQDRDAPIPSHLVYGRIDKLKENYQLLKEAANDKKD